MWSSALGPDISQCFVEDYRELYQGKPKSYRLALIANRERITTVTKSFILLITIVYFTN